MTREIHKKLSKEYFDLVLSGQKTYEFRVADFECEPGDALILEEYEYENDDESSPNRHPTGRAIRKIVGHVGKTKDFAWANRPDIRADADQYGYQIISLIEQDDLWEVSVKAIIFNAERTKALLPLYSDGVYSMVGGHVDHGETFDAALRREIKEETGVDFTGEITEMGISKQEWTKRTGREIHKIVLFYSLTIPENTPLIVEEKGADKVSTASLDWLPVDDILAGKFNIFADYRAAIQKALEKDAA